MNVVPIACSEIAGAVLPLARLGVLTELRDRPGIDIVVAGEKAWITWKGEGDAVLQRLLPARGVELYVQRGDDWYRFGSRLPTTGVPFPGKPRSLVHLLQPAPFAPAVPDWEPILRRPIRLLRSARPAIATALRCPLAALAAWADLVPSNRLSALQAVRLDATILVKGPRLPWLPDAERFCGERLLLPLGWRTDPDLPPAALCAALGASDQEIIVWSANGTEAIPTSLFCPLSRAALRLGLEG